MSNKKKAMIRTLFRGKDSEQAMQKLTIKRTLLRYRAQHLKISHGTGTHILISRGVGRFNSRK